MRRRGRSGDKKTTARCWFFFQLFAHVSWTIHGRPTRVRRATNVTTAPPIETQTPSSSPLEVEDLPCGRIAIQDIGVAPCNGLRASSSKSLVG